MQLIQEINIENCPEIKALYEDFRVKAMSDYRYQASPIDFEQFQDRIAQKKLGAFVLKNNETPEGILIYSLEKFNIVEINVIHPDKRPILAKALIDLYKDRADWQVISYPMLGVQENDVKDIALPGYKFVGQSIMRFDFLDPVSYRILQMDKNNDLRGNTLSCWDDKYKEQAIELIHAAFKNNKMTNFDPRFRTVKGANDVYDSILNNEYGVFLPNQCRIFIKDNRLEGFCFVVLAQEDKINIPLVAIRKDERNSGLGKCLLKTVITGFAGLIADKKVTLKEINATADTDNYPAIKMYRRLGFREEYFYPHAYYKNPDYKA